MALEGVYEKVTMVLSEVLSKGFGLDKIYERKPSFQTEGVKFIITISL